MCFVAAADETEASCARWFAQSNDMTDAAKDFSLAALLRYRRDTDEVRIAVGVASEGAELLDGRSPYLHVSCQAPITSERRYSVAGFQA